MEKLDFADNLNYISNALYAMKHMFVEIIGSSCFSGDPQDERAFEGLEKFLSDAFDAQIDAVERLEAEIMDGSKREVA